MARFHLPYLTGGCLYIAMKILLIAEIQLLLILLNLTKGRNKLTRQDLYLSRIFDPLHKTRFSRNLF